MVEEATGETKVKIKFLSDQVYETEGRNQGRRFTAGRVYTLTEDQAQRWIRRDVAELVEESTEADGDEPPKPRRGRPPKAKAAEGDGDEIDVDEEPLSDPKEPPPVRVADKPPEAKPPEPAGPGPRFVAQPQQPAKAPDKGR